MSATKAVIRQQEMPQEMLDYIVAKTIVAQEQFNSEKEIASFLKKEMQDIYQATWHVVIGRFFGSYVTHEKNCYCYFYVGQMGVLAWKTP
mmetsp:Transcript_8027/g.19332  ORF Transcript_8027/g.19332 Transcript_8027/m.19332 type:complete len:90 (+) Transcript_8027:138-407(+)|eukprot:CAMPEP_0178988428 /NCGR_PEP_ID=MMETSP0795-20121207/3806_1 /TAXON_ID=88552 /ORGANISM="Amoebophrya sp., Strain Ameob2" /LENGTH=89 /DNA_ID=CAMNT_0020679703 /DNA_START=104 /DNA_END=373 /DNA_ORIENTATION=+